MLIRFSYFPWCVKTEPCTFRYPKVFSRFLACQCQVWVIYLAFSTQVQGHTRNHFKRIVWIDLTPRSSLMSPRSKMGKHVVKCEGHKIQPHFQFYYQIKAFRFYTFSFVINSFIFFKTPTELSLRNILMS